jgi:hypothetical protein
VPNFSGHQVAMPTHYNFKAFQFELLSAISPDCTAKGTSALLRLPQVLFPAMLNAIFGTPYIFATVHQVGDEVDVSCDHPLIIAHN